MTAHTPGPWRVDLWRYSGRPEGFRDVTTIVGERDAIAQIMGLYRPESDVADTSESDANAKLIAAAPELFEACKSLLQALEAHVDEAAKEAGVTRGQYCPCNADEVAQGKRAIANAIGGSS